MSDAVPNPTEVERFEQLLKAVRCCFLEHGDEEGSDFVILDAAEALQIGVVVPSAAFAKKLPLSDLADILARGYEDCEIEIVSRADEEDLKNPIAVVTSRGFRTRF